MESRPSKFYICVPGACRSIRRSGHIEGVESSDGLGADCPGMQMSPCIIEFHHGRMIVWQFLTGIRFHCEGQMYVISGSPHSPIPIDITPHTLFCLDSAHIEAAERIGRAFPQFKIGNCIGSLCHNHERFPRAMETDLAVRTGDTSAKFLLLIAIDLHLHSLQRLSRYYVIDKDAHIP